MDKLPIEVLDFLVEKTVKNRSLAYIVVDENGRVINWNNEVNLYVKCDLHRDENLADILPFLEGYFPIDHDELHLPTIETDNGLMADVYLVRKSNVIYIILLDKSLYKERVQQFLQNRNEDQLAFYKYENLKNDLSIFDISAFLDLLILEYLPPTKYNVIGIVPQWVDFISQNNQKSISENELINRFPFIENYLIDAKSFWHNNTRGKLKSDLWTETNKLNKEVHLEATALKVKNRDFLLIEYAHSSTEEKFNLIQRARELKLEHELRIKAEEALSKQNILLNELNATKDKFFSIIAHDLRNPLAAFRNIIELLTNYYDDLSEEKIKKTIKMLDDNSSHLYKLLENLLQWSRSQTGAIQFNPELQSVAAVIKMNVSLMKVNAEKKNIDFSYDIDDDLVAYYDADLINTVLRNLLTNAIKFSKPGGKVSITAGNKNGYIEVRIKDNGIGIKEEDIEKLFRIDIHHTTPGTLNETGTGLGLILCKEFIDIHKCRIYAESKEGQGSTFSFTLPEKDFRQ
jgi:signal transduction histidine kinase